MLLFEIKSCLWHFEDSKKPTNHCELTSKAKHINLAQCVMYFTNLMTEVDECFLAFLEIWYMYTRSQSFYLCERRHGLEAWLRFLLTPACGQHLFLLWGLVVDT